MSLVANLLTLLRIVLIPFIIRAILVNDDQGALIMFLVASVTDFLDGFIARKFNAVSKFGRMLDPIADKMLVAAVLIMLVATPLPGAPLDGYMHPRADLIPVVIIIMREILVSGLREFLAVEAVLMPVTKLAKWKTAFQFFALLALLAAPLTESVIINGAEINTQQAGQVMLWIAATLTAITGWQYFRYTMREGFRGAKVLEVKLIDSKE